MKTVFVLRNTKTVFMKVPGSQSEFRSFLTAQFALPGRTVGSFAHAEEVGKVEIKLSD